MTCGWFSKLGFCFGSPKQCGTLIKGLFESKDTCRFHVLRAMKGFSGLQPYRTEVRLQFVLQPWKVLRTATRREKTAASGGLAIDTEVLHAPVSESSDSQDGLEHATVRVKKPHRAREEEESSQ